MENNKQVAVDVLGTRYTMEIVDRFSADLDAGCTAWCDLTRKHIEIMRVDDEDPRNRVWEYRHVVRHELVHAFLFESGLHDSWWCDHGNKEETIVDWIAHQSDKLFCAFHDAEVLYEEDITHIR